MARAMKSKAKGKAKAGGRPKDTNPKGINSKMYSKK